MSKKNIQEHCNFTMNCNVLNLKYINSENWEKKIISLPGAIKDLKNKQIKLHKVSHPTTLFACARFMSQGFKKPSSKEIDLMIDGLSKIGVNKFDKNVNKMINYVGSKKETQKIIKKLGIKKNIFNLKDIKK